MNDKKENATVIIVDDSKKTCVIMEQIIRSNGFEVVTHQDPIEAYSQLEQKNCAEDIKAIFLDVRMPGMNGLELLTKLRNLDPYKSTSIIMLTANDSDKDMMEGYSNGADYYMTKPTTKNQIAYALRFGENSDDMNGRKNTREKTL